MTTDMSQTELRPYFLWDEDVSIAELRAIVADEEDPRRMRLLGKLLREARDPDVWACITPQDVDRLLPQLGRRLGRRRDFWEFLIEGWKADGLLR